VFCGGGGIGAAIAGGRPGGYFLSGDNNKGTSINSKLAVAGALLSSLVLKKKFLFAHRIGSLENCYIWSNRESKKRIPK
jgi:hypothetical protein